MGWYFKHQHAEETIAFIPGWAKSGAFVQVITNAFSRQFPFPHLCVDEDIRVGNCVFGRHGCNIQLPGIKGELCYGPLAPLRSDIMGPFRFFPLQCRHGVISMDHSLSGVLEIEGRRIDFSGGKGYIEHDSGFSFPKSYLWLQCNDFPTRSSVMLSVAHIPFAGFHFTGCLCAILHEGREYRLATYQGVKILRADAQGIVLTQGDYLLHVDMESVDGQPLQAPRRGQMTGVIHENHATAGRFCLFEQDRLILDLESKHVSFEYVS